MIFAIFQIPFFQIAFLTYYNGFIVEGTTGLDQEKVVESSDRFNAITKKYHKFLELILDHLNELFQPDAFLSASAGDARWLETIRVARQKKLCWTVAEREGCRSRYCRKNEFTCSTKSNCPGMRFDVYNK